MTSNVTHTSTSISPIKAYQDNYIWCIHNQNQAWVVDPGDSNVVENYLSTHKLTLSGILVTHHHWDHITGIKDLIKDRNIPVIGPNHVNVPEITHIVKEQDQIDVLDIQLSIMEVPGHTLEHIAYFGQPTNQSSLLFCGDTLFSAGCGRLFEGTPQQMHAALTRFKQLPEETRVYCTHEYTQANLNFAQTVEPNNTAIQQELQRVQSLDLTTQPSLPSSIRKEKEINPFIRCDTTAVQEQLKKHFSNQINTAKLPMQESDYFALLRSWKDTF
jgi:hydroxyacylglutathione hydrolase